MKFPTIKINLITVWKAIRAIRKYFHNQNINAGVMNKATHDKHVSNEKSLLLLFLFLFSCTPVVVEPEFCWICEGKTVVTFERKDPVLHISISEICRMTQSDISQREKDGTWKSTLISQGDTVIYETVTKCHIKL